ncbi:hypothetical protein FH972_027225 [Carpinus fangiana]|uniref:Uncharacterized protein n=1 Tax=Carpinus fangiana TaxID=176857 RepID=A0A5N6L6N5_9ROSI|nr:hypothetical protein FH972_027225 [Carpinus fangiana]
MLPTFGALLDNTRTPTALPHTLFSKFSSAVFPLQHAHSPLLSPKSQISSSPSSLFQNLSVLSYFSPKISVSSFFQGGVKVCCPANPCAATRPPNHAVPVCLTAQTSHHESTPISDKSEAMINCSHKTYFHVFCEQ